MKISLNKNLINSTNMTPLQLSKITGISSRPTIYQMVDGTWSPQSFEMLARFLTGLGWTTEKMKNAMVTDLFEVTDDKPS
jgi:hypothetical protein